MTSAQVNQLKKMQNKAARLVTCTPRLHHITPVLEQLHWLPVECRIQFKVIVMVFKSLHSEAPSYLCDLLQPRKVDSRLRSDSAIIIIIINIIIINIIIIIIITIIIIIIMASF